MAVDVDDFGALPVAKADEKEFVVEGDVYGFAAAVDSVAHHGAIVHSY